MKQEVLNAAYSLKEEISNDSRIVRLNELERMMENDDEVILLVSKKEDRVNAYSDMIRYFKEDSEEVKNARIELMKAKEELQNHPIVREYLSCYQEVRGLYDNVNEILFSKLSTNLCPKE